MIKRPPKLFHVTITANGATDRTQLNDIDCSRLTLIAHPSNSGSIYWGDENVTNASGILMGVPAAAGEGVSDLPVSNSNQIYVSADTANDKVICIVT